MRTLRVFTMVVALFALTLAIACGGNNEPNLIETSEPTSDDPISSGLVAPDTFLTFDGQRYELQETLQADLLGDEFVEVGVASEADIDHEGDLADYSRTGDASSVYTFSPAIDEIGEESDTPGLWLKWEPVQ